MRFTDELREAAGDQWNRVVNHKFTDELAEGTIDRNILKRYLIQDHKFLDAFVVLLSSVVAHARCLKDRIPGCQFLALITGTENTYFERSLDKLGVSSEQSAAVPAAPPTVKFCELMQTVASEGTLGEMLAVIVVCEWSYLSWGERVLSKTNRDDFATYEWVDLHSGDYFASVVEYLRTLLDKEGGLVDQDGKDKCKARFLEAVQCEEDFFNHVYEE